MNGALEEHTEDQCIIVCQGLPRCDLKGHAAYEAQRDGCVWCQRIWIDATGQERVQEPGNA